MRFTSRELLLILNALSSQYGMGYSDNPEVGKLQAKLSIMLEVAAKMEDANKSTHPAAAAAS